MEIQVPFPPQQTHLHKQPFWQINKIEDNGIVFYTFSPAAHPGWFIALSGSNVVLTKVAEPSNTVSHLDSLFVMKF